jgi:hypothetical protein
MALNFIATLPRTNAGPAPMAERDAFAGRFEGRAERLHSLDRRQNLPCPESSP